MPTASGAAGYFRTVLLAGTSGRRLREFQPASHGIPLLCAARSLSAVLFNRVEGRALRLLLAIGNAE
jgi:hypothetical protein